MGKLSFYRTKMWEILVCMLRKYWLLFSLIISFSFLGLFFFFFTRLLRSNESDVGVSVFGALASELA